MDESVGSDGDDTSPEPMHGVGRRPLLLSLLATLAGVLATVFGAEEAVEVLLQRGLAGVEADGGALTVKRGQKLLVIGAAGYAHVALRDRRVLDMALDVPLVVAAREETPVWVSDRSDAGTRFPTALRFAPDAQAFAAVPLVIDGTVVGSFGATFGSPREFDEIDRWFLRTLAEFAAGWLAAHPAALEPVPPMILVGRDPIATTGASTDFDARVGLVAEALTGELRPSEVMEIVVRQAMAALGAEGGTVALLDADQTLLPMATVGYSDKTVAGYGALTLDRVLPLTVAARTGDAVWVESFAEALRRFPALADGPTGSQAWAAVPLLEHGRAFAVLGISFAVPHSFSGSEREFLRTLGHLAALRLRT